MVKKSIGQNKMRAAMERRLARGAAKMRRKRERAVVAHCPKSANGTHRRERDYDGSWYCGDCFGWRIVAWFDTPSGWR